MSRITHPVRTLTPRRLMKLLPALALVALVLPAAPAAHAQATRTWVSGVGDDANPCSRTAPCKTFAGAISKTAANGEINALDPGGFGGVTINKSITLNACAVGEGGVLVSGTNAIVINAGATDRVIIKCLDIDGLGNSLDGIRFIAGKSLKVVNTEIFGFARNAINVISSTPGAKALIAHNFLHDNTGVGVMVDPPNASSATVTVRDNDIVGNACGVVAAQFGPDPAFNFSSNCGTSSNASGISAVAVVNTFTSLITDSNIGVFSRGANAFNRIGNNQIINNTTGIGVLDGGSMLSFGGNLMAGNGSNGSTTGPNIPPVRPVR